MTPEQSAHIGRVVSQHTALTNMKYAAGQREHGGNCWEKPGMLEHALAEAADLPVYLWTLREQMSALARKCRQNATTLSDAADEIERWLRA